jgi:hypothetical protein
MIHHLERQDPAAEVVCRTLRMGIAVLEDQLRMLPETVCPTL